jgi:hypothetical protein
VRKWVSGYEVVGGGKRGTHDSLLMARVRRSCYWLVAKLASDVELVHNFTGFGRRGADAPRSRPPRVGKGVGQLGAGAAFRWARGS